MTTDRDLRSTLLDALDSEMDVAAFRARLDRAIAVQDPTSGAVSDAETGADVGDVFELQHHTHSKIGRLHRRTSWAIAIAACLAAIATLTGLVVIHTDRTPTADRSAPPRVLGSRLFPGSTVLGVFHGTGRRTVPFPAGHATPGQHEHYLALFVCSSGPWGLHGQPHALVAAGGSGKCGDMHGAIGLSLSRSTTSVQVFVHHDTTWRLAIVIEPDLRTNAGVESGGSIGAQRGPLHSGNGTVTLPRPHSWVNNDHHELIMTCRGSGLRLSGMNGAVHGDYTHTCFPGYAYVWDFNRLDLPATLHVHAAAGTTWTARLW